MKPYAEELQTTGAIDVGIFVPVRESDCPRRQKCIIGT